MVVGTDLGHGAPSLEGRNVQLSVVRQEERRVAHRVLRTNTQDCACSSLGHPKRQTCNQKITMIRAAVTTMA